VGTARCRGPAHDAIRLRLAADLSGEGGFTLLAALLAGGNEPQQPNWQLLGKSTDGNSERFIDVAGIRIQGGIRSASINTIYEQHTREVPPGSGRWAASLPYGGSVDRATRQVGMGEGVGCFEHGTYYAGTVPNPRCGVGTGTVHGPHREVHLRVGRGMNRSERDAVRPSRAVGHPGAPMCDGRFRCPAEPR
jgi:hypothetical protein